jgi:hypothetical protein
MGEREKGQIFRNGRGWVSNNRRERGEGESTDWKATGGCVVWSGVVTTWGSESGVLSSF